MDAVLAMRCVDISEPPPLRGRMLAYPAYCLCSVRWSLADLTSDHRRSPCPRPAATGRPEPSASPRPVDLEAGEWEIPRVSLQYERIAFAGTAVRKKLGSAPVTVRGRAYDVVRHEQLLAPEPADAAR